VLPDACRQLAPLIETFSVADVVVVILCDLWMLSMQPSHWVCKPAYLVPVPSQDKLGACGRKGIWHKNGGSDRGGGTS